MEKPPLSASTPSQAACISQREKNELNKQIQTEDLLKQFSGEQQD